MRRRDIPFDLHQKYMNGENLYTSQILKVYVGTYIKMLPPPTG